VNGGTLDLSSARRVGDAEYRSRVRRMTLITSDIVYTREGERFGHAALVPSGVNVCLGQRMMQFRVSRRWDASYLMWQMNSRSVYGQAVLDTTGSTSPHVNVNSIRNFGLAKPPLDEQVIIAAYLMREVMKIDGLIAKVREGLYRTAELRNALIFAAVTGKIDVRQEVS
jgi:type I restriction enzyme S subunit